MIESPNYIEKPVGILVRETKVLWNQEVRLVEVQRQHRRGSIGIWEWEEVM